MINWSSQQPIWSRNDSRRCNEKWIYWHPGCSLVTSMQTRARKKWISSAPTSSRFVRKEWLYLSILNPYDVSISRRDFWFHYFWLRVATPFLTRGTLDVVATLQWHDDAIRLPKPMKFTSETVLEHSKARLTNHDHRIVQIPSIKFVLPLFGKFKGTRDASYPHVPPS